MQQEEKEYKNIDLSTSNVAPRPQDQAAQESHGEATSSGASGLTNLVVKYSGGLIKTPRQANYFLLILVIALLSLSAYITFETMKPPKTDNSGGVLPRGIQDQMQRLNR